MELDYDIHLKPATDLRKTKGEDAAIDYLFGLLHSNTWSDYEQGAILDKAGGYFKKASESNKEKLIKALHGYVESNDGIGLEHKIIIYSRLSDIYKAEKDIDKAFQMMRGAIVNSSPAKDHFLSESSRLYSKVADILSLKDITSEKNARSFLYYYLAHFLFERAWYDYISSVGAQEQDWDSIAGNLFTRHKKSPTAFEVVSTKNEVQTNLKNFGKLLNEIFPTEAKEISDNSGIAVLIDRKVNEFLESC